MLSHMETDVAVEVATEIWANIYHHTRENGKTDETEEDIKIVLSFKRKALREFKNMNFEEVKSFAKTWLKKYPNNR